MRENYIAPELEVIEFEADDVITTSTIVLELDENDPYGEN